MKIQNLAPALFAVVVLAAGCADRTERDRRLELLQDKPSPRQLTLALTFEDDVVDSSLAMRELSHENVALIPEGVVGAAARFDGTAVIRVPGLEIPEAGAWSLWFRIPEETDPPREMRLLDANGYAVFVANQRLLAIFNDGRNIHLRGEPGGLETGRWHHAALAWGGERVALFLDGEMIDHNDTYAGRPGFPERNLVIGNRWTGTGRPFVGDLDEILIYRGDFPEDQIAALAEEGRDPQPQVR